MTNDVTTQCLERISVAPPYFALGRIEPLDAGSLRADFPLSPAATPEVGTIAAGEAARHLAILGSCAAAWQREDDRRHHYLATTASYRRLGEAPEDECGTLRAEATALWLDRKRAKATITLRTEHGVPLRQLDCTYMVLAPRMFARFNPPIDLDRLPTDEPLTEPEVVDVDTWVEADHGPIPASLCAGHFPGYPAAPVAVLMGRLCRVAGIAMGRSLGEPDHLHRIESGAVEATGLARAGQRLVLRAGYDRPVGHGHQMTGVAEADGEVVGRVTVTMTTHAADSVQLDRPAQMEVAS